MEKKSTVKSYNITISILEPEIDCLLAADFS